jgi:transcription-repair coupling factor (superfamily II helicase)
MFKSLKLYVGASIDLERLPAELVDFGYRRQERVQEEGDFARRGELIDIFAFSFELPIRLELGHDNTVQSIKSFNPSTGEPLWQHQMVIVLPLSRAHPSKTVTFSEEHPIENFVDLESGDFVVHTEHGIGRYLGLEKIKIGDKYLDHLVVEYDQAEKLYVPAKSMHLVQKYIAFAARRPKLNRLGSHEWQRVKERARRGIQKMAWDLLSLEAMRKAAAGFKFSPDTDWQAEFEKTFPYKETIDQARASRDVKLDMESAKPMDRLLCGDVGYGKTEVAMRAAFKATQDFKQVAFLVPTTILAEQHYQNFSQRLKDFPVNIQMLCRFQTGQEQRRIIEGLAGGTVDIVIGTHRLLSDDIRFKDLGLVVIDEEQRFGVRAKEKLKALRLSSDILTMTATPIPRTLYMSLMGAKDLSAINTPPQNRLPIRTSVVEYDLDLIRQAITRELDRKGQVYFIHNRVHDIDKIEEKIRRLLSGSVRIGVAHGQMSARTLEAVMAQFLKRQIDVLISTMIIESGIDMPYANTIIVDQAQDFGLSDLHQLRGRVGRFDRPAYAYFLVPRQAVLDSDAKKRLEAISRYAQLGSGFQIAMEDLELRGAGNILGVQQHGFIAAVGFDLYCRLLREAISTFKKASINAG